MKRISDSQTTQTHLTRYQHLNGQRRLFGGALLQWIDELAGIVALRHVGGEVITANVDNLVFKAPAFLNDLLVMQGRITYIGRTSMEVRVDTYAERRDGSQELINRAYLVMVALGDDGAPKAIPRVELAGEEEEREWALGEKRYQLRQLRRREQY